MMYFIIGMYEITVESSFSAAHRLNDYQGPCENLHGHNWLVRVMVRRPVLDTCGLVIDFRVLKQHLKAVIGEFDHKDLNAVLDPLHINPSSENIARYIFDKLENALAGWDGIVSRVEVFETPGCCAAYFR
ncbi:MAG: 6-carboxytetrahydropterin synthase QueD [Chitinispirillaceae bacterium]|nr:6-carboxytetrahydropterin synthase QueD [Chitinispirillaceae bacterium]